MRIGMLLAAMALLPATPASAVSQHWVASWGSAQQVPEPNNALADADMQDATLRQVVRLSMGGRQLRVRFSNAFGRQPLVIDDASLARSADKASSRIVPGTARALTFDGRRSVVIPAGADYLSDPIRFDAPALSSVAVSMHLPQAPAGQTGHPGARATSYYVHGGHTDDVDLPGAASIAHWYQLTGIEVLASGDASAVVAFGDSITDGRGATTNGDNRWPDVLAERLQRSGAQRNLSVVNMGIGGNHLLTDGLGPNALARLDRDVFARPAAKYLLVLEAINDIGGISHRHPTADQRAQLRLRVIAAYRQIVARAHAQGLKVIGCTITPFGGSGYYRDDPSAETDRQALNQLIRAGGLFDGFFDFDKAIRDPQHPDQMLPVFDSGDHLHPSVEGYKAMAQSADLSLLR